MDTAGLRYRVGVQVTRPGFGRPARRALVGIFAAVTRKGIDGSTNGPQEALTLEDAIYNATVGSAYMTFDEKTRGTREPGHVADMVVPEQDIFTIDPAKILTLKPAETIVGDKTVWRTGDPIPDAAAH